MFFIYHCIHLNLLLLLHVDGLTGLPCRLCSVQASTQPSCSLLPLHRACKNGLITDPKSVDFQMKILERSGLGEETCIPPAMHYIPPTPNMTREEAELVIFSCMDSLFQNTGLKPNDVDILVLNCSLLLGNLKTLRLSNEDPFSSSSPPEQFSDHDLRCEWTVEKVYTTAVDRCRN